MKQLVHKVHKFNSLNRNPPHHFQTQHGHSPANNEQDKDSFQAVPSKHKRKPLVYGTRNSTSAAKPMARERSEALFSIFIGGISNEYSEADLKDYIQKELKVDQVTISVNKINPRNRS